MEGGCFVRTYCSLSFALKLALVMLVLGFSIGFYLGLGPGRSSSGVPGPAIDQSMSFQQVPVRIQ